MNKFDVEKNTIHFRDGQIIEFEYPIDEKEIITIDFVIIIRLVPPPKSYYNNNVFALTEKGDLLWQINIEEQYIKNNDCPFVGISINEKGQLVLFNWCDLAFIVDPITGRVLSRFVTH